MMDTKQLASEIRGSFDKLDAWVVGADWKAYDTFDGLASPFAKYLTLGVPVLRQVWQQGVRRFPINLRPLLGIKPNVSSKAMAFFAQGYLSVYKVDNDSALLDKAKFCLKWLMENPSKGYKGYCWGNHFDYHARGGNIPPGCPTIVWTGWIGHAFMDAYEMLGDEAYLDVANSACEFILKDLGWQEFKEGILLRYYPNNDSLVHNSSMIGASLLARVHSHRANKQYVEVADRAMQFSVHHQREDGAWYYGVGPKWAWIDSFHTAYNLECLDLFTRYSGINKYDAALQKGYKYFIDTFFLEDGTPRYYDYKTLPLDIQCASQAIQTLVNMRRHDKRSVNVASKVARWTIQNMQDKEGYFYYRKYPLVTNKTPTMHWGQATMSAALGVLYACLKTSTEKVPAKKSELATV